MHMVTILVDCEGDTIEVGFGEGETEESALDEAFASVSAMDRDLIEEYGCRFSGRFV